MKKFLLAACLMALALGAVPTFAQQASAPTVSGQTGLFTLVDSWTLPQGAWSLGFYYNNWDHLVAPVPGGVARPLTDNWGYDWNRLSASVGYGISDAFELSLMLPYEDFSASDNRHVGYLNGQLFRNKIDAKGIGNAVLGAKYRLFGSAEDGTGLALNAFIEAPTGDENEAVVTGGTGWGVGVNWDFAPNWLARVGYHDVGAADNFDVANEVQAGLGYSTAINSHFDWITELAASFYQGGDSNPDDVFDLTSGGRYWFGQSGNWAVNFGLRLELNQLSDTDEHCPVGGLVGLTFHPRAKGHKQILEERLAAEKAAEEARIAAEAAAAAQAAQEKAAAEKAAADKAASDNAAAAAQKAAADEAANQAAAQASAAKQSEETIQFPSSGDRLSNIAKAKLDEVALRLKQSPAATAVIIGHADNQGTDAANQRLGMHRAEAAKAYLVKRHQLDGNRISVESRGGAEPIASNDTEAGREQNRRIVIVVQLP
ncbi:MAG: OmpA family protein [Thermoanaerobaculia bacterium]